jgi:hypothetical protein
LDQFASTVVLLKLILFVICQIHLHAGNDAPLNVTFLRAPSSALLKVDVPLVYRGEDSSPGLKKGLSPHPLLSLSLSEDRDQALLFCAHGNLNHYLFEDILITDH